LQFTYFTQRNKIMNNIPKNPVKKKMSRIITIPAKYPIDYKYIFRLKKFINKYGKIRPRRITKLSLKQQRQVAKAIRKARAMRIIPSSINYIAQ